MRSLTGCHHRIDAHAHVLQQGEASTAVNLVGATSLQGAPRSVDTHSTGTLIFHERPAEVVDRIARFVEADPELQADRSRFILGLGWDQTKYADTGREFPTAVRPVHLSCPCLADIRSRRTTSTGIHDSQDARFT